MFQRVHALWRRLSKLLHCSDGSVSATSVVEFASLVLQDDILLPLCPVATEELLLCLHVDKSVHAASHAPIWLLPQQHKACSSSWSWAPSSRGWLQKRCLLPRRSTRSAEGLRHPCTHSQTEVEAQLRRFSTVDHVLEIRRTSCTRAGSESVSHCAVLHHNVFQHLRTHRHLQFPSNFATHTSCRQGRNQHPFDKEQTLFHVQLCSAKFRLDFVKREQCTSVCTKITPVSLLSERQNWFLNCTRVERHSNCSSFWKFCMSPVVLLHVGVELHLQCAFSDQATVLLSWIRDRTSVKLCCQEANTLRQLVSM